jgi:hypothetical protein
MCSAHPAFLFLSGDYHEYFGLGTNVDACVYCMLANEVIHKNKVIFMRGRGLMAPFAASLHQAERKRKRNYAGGSEIVGGTVERRHSHLGGGSEKAYALQQGLQGLQKKAFSQELQLLANSLQQACTRRQ